MTLNDRASLAERRRVPAEIERQMKRYRAGLIAMPRDYISWHYDIAEEVLEALAAKYGLRVIEKTLRDAGWFDGMEEMNAIVEDHRGRVHRLVYCDANQGFMEKLGAGGQGTFKPEELFR